MSTTKSIKGTKTEQYVVNAYINESQSNARYTFYAKVANKEQNFPIEEAFNEAAANELHHAKVFLKLLEDNQLPCAVTVDAGYLGKTVDNLVTAMNEEAKDGIKYYQEAAVVAHEEGFDDIAAHFQAIAEVEITHLHRFHTYYEQVKNSTVWKREKPTQWMCMVCGYIFTGTEPPKVCPACDHPYQHYKALDNP